MPFVCLEAVLFILLFLNADMFSIYIPKRFIWSRKTLYVSARLSVSLQELELLLDAHMFPNYIPKRFIRSRLIS